MVSKARIKSLEFNTIENYFDYIVESEINGQRAQVKELIKDLSKAQKKECIKHLKSNFIGAEEDKNTVLDILNDYL